MFAKAAKMSTEDFRKAMQDGKILAKDILPALAEVLRSRIDPSVLDKALTSPLRKFERMRTAYSRFLDKLGEAGVYDLLANAFDKLGEGLDWLTKNIKPLKEMLVSLFKVALIGAGAYGLGALFISLKNISSGVGLVTAAMIKLRAALVLHPLTLFTAAAVILYLVIEDLYTALSGGDSVLGRLAQHAGPLGTLAKVVLDLADGLKELFIMLFAIKDGNFDIAGDAIKNAGGSLQGAFGKVFGEQFSKGLGGIGAGLDFFTNTMPIVKTPTTHNSNNQPQEVKLTLDVNASPELDVKMMNAAGKVVDSRLLGAQAATVVPGG